MLNVTRTWNSVSACALMRRGLALARDYARKRVVFGAPLCGEAAAPRHARGPAGRVAGRVPSHVLRRRAARTERAGQASEQHEQLLRILTPVAKLLTGKQAVQVLSEVIESFGGAGYVEDTGLPVLLRDAQVLPIWEGTTNVLSLDTLRALEAAGGLGVVRREAGYILQGVREPDLVRISARVEKALEQAETWLAQAAKAGTAQLEAGARRFAMTLGRALSLALLARHAQWSIRNEQDSRMLAASAALRGAGREPPRDGRRGRFPAAGARWIIPNNFDNGEAHDRQRIEDFIETPAGRGGGVAGSRRAGGRLPLGRHSRLDQSHQQIVVIMALRPCI